MPVIPSETPVILYNLTWKITVKSCLNLDQVHPAWLSFIFSKNAIVFYIISAPMHVFIDLTKLY